MGNDCVKANPGEDVGMHNLKNQAVTSGGGNQFDVSLDAGNALK